MLPDTGNLVYGDVTWDCLYHSSVSGRPQYDKAKRAVKAITYTIEVDGAIVTKDGNPVDPTWRKLRQQLQAPGLGLAYKGKGFGSLLVNLPNGVKDVAWGPKPEILDFTPMGNGLSALIKWRVETTIPECQGFKTTNTVIAFNWNTDLTFPEDAYAKYTVSGELEIAMTYGSTNSLEYYRNLTEPPLPLGFRVLNRNFKMSDDKRTFIFSYSYEELPPMGIPINCTKANGQYGIESDHSKSPWLNFGWNANLQATYTLRPDAPRREAYMRFLGLMIDRQSAAALLGVLPGVAAQGQAAPGRGLPGVLGLGLGVLNNFADAIMGRGNFQELNRARIAALRARGGSNPGTTRPMIRSFGFTEGLYLDSKSITFKSSWFFGTTQEHLIAASGVWRKMTDSGANAWRASMQDVMGYKSWSFYRFNPKLDVVIDACSDVGPSRLIQNFGLGGQRGLTPNRNLLQGAELFGVWQDPDKGLSPERDFELPAMNVPEASWLSYSNEIVTELDSGMALHKSLPREDYDVDTLASVDAFAARPESNSRDDVNWISKSTQSDRVQRAATSTYRICLRGFGIRAGFKIPVPGLVSFAGVTPVVDRQRAIGPRVLANYSGIPIYATGWELWYHIPDPPKAIQKPPPNLAQHIGQVDRLPTGIKVPVSLPETGPPMERMSLPTAVQG